MKKINRKYYSVVNQRPRTSGTIENTTKGIIVELSNNDVSKEEFVDNFLSSFRSTYDIGTNNKKEYKKFLNGLIKEQEEYLERLKFAHKICGRKILEDR